MRLTALSAVVFVATGSLLHAAETVPFSFEQALVIGQIGRTARSPIRFDAVEHQIVLGTFSTPEIGGSITAPDGTVRSWEQITAKEGRLETAARGSSYAYATFESDADRTVLLEASGHSLVYVNGSPRVGDPYNYGFVRVPVPLRKGTNEFVFVCGRGSLRANLLPCPSERPYFAAADDTLPDLVAGTIAGSVMGLVVVNPTDAVLRDAAIRISGADGIVVTTPLPALPPFALHKAVADLAPATALESGTTVVEAVLTVGGRSVAQRSIELRVVDPRARRNITFRSEIDGSVQYYAAVPSTGDEDAVPGLVLSLHGASVEAHGQAAAYQPKSFAVIACPTNRRAYGFDWEDWGRWDAMEVLADARERFHTDPLRQWLTGHSMGGHGTWQIGAHFADEFAAIAPSAGWISFASYGGVQLNSEGVEGMFARASSASDTLALARNYGRLGVYILHGDMDDNVPVTQARAMRAVLGGSDGSFHSDFSYYERRGAGHWWGAECVDWPPLMRFFEERSRTETAAIDRIDFVTAAPSVAARCDWLTIDQQTEPMRTSTVTLMLDRAKRTVAGTTGNVARLKLAPPLDAGSISITLDDTTVETSLDQSTPLWLERDGSTWRMSAVPDPATKCADRSGPFKDAFRRRAMFVYGTAGDPAMDVLLLEKARYDAETFWYRGNGGFEIVADTDFDPADEPDRNVILYGNAQTNAAWAALLGQCPVLVKDGLARVGEREFDGNDLACTFVYPRPGSRSASVGVVASTGPAGRGLTTRLPYFVSGVGYPDLTILAADTLLSGVGGIRLAGFFGNDWSVDRGVWTDSPTP